jgi:hypothetical protein
MKDFKCWLWPDRYIGKLESAGLREEHNHAINEIARLREALRNITVRVDGGLVQSVQVGSEFITATVIDFDPGDNANHSEDGRDCLIYSA